MSTSDRTKALKWCSENGVTVDLQTERHRSVPKQDHREGLILDAPPRMVFRCGTLHYLVFESDAGGPLDWSDVLDRISYGLTPCTVPRCDIC